MDGSKPDYIFATRTLYHTMEKNAIFLCALATVFFTKNKGLRWGKTVFFVKIDKSLHC